MFTKRTQVKRLLVIIVVVVFVAVGGISLVIFRSFAQYYMALQKQTIAEQIESKVYERRLIGLEYLLSSLDRAKNQWLVLQNDIEELVVSMEQLHQTPAEKTYIEAVKESLQESRQTFQNITTPAKEAISPLVPEAQTTYKNRIASELTLKAQQSLDAAHQLHALNNQVAAAALSTINVLFLTAAGLLGILLAVCFLIIWRNALALERRRAEDEAILGSIGDGVFAIDPDGRIILFNRAAEALSGFSRNEAMFQPYDDIFHFQSEQSGQKVDNFIKQSLAGQGAAMAAHTLLRQKSGTLLPVADSAAPIRTNGDVLGAVVVFRDVTKEREVERMKDEFLSVASHELRTPMGAVRANISMILNGDYGPVNKELVEPLTDMRTSTIRLVDLVNDLLNVARIEAGRLKFNLEDADIAQVVQKAVHSLAPLGKEKGLSVAIGHTDPIQVHIDPDKVTQVLTNLMGNALKFTDSGSITVSASVGKDDDMVIIEIADTGMGISPEDQRKLFGKFKQISSAQQGKPAGTGLGLYISREIIRKMGGELWIKSSLPGKGSVFAFTVPLSNSKRAVEADAAIEQEARNHPDQK